MTERLKFAGRLREKELEARSLRLRIIGLREAIRDGLDPFEKVRNLPLEVVASQAVEAAELQAQYVGILTEIEDIKRILGR